MIFREFSRYHHIITKVGDVLYLPESYVLRNYFISGESVDKTCTRVIIVIVLLILALSTTIYTVHSNNGNIVAQVRKS